MNRRVISANPFHTYLTEKHLRPMRDILVMVSPCYLILPYHREPALRDKNARGNGMTGFVIREMLSEISVMT